MERSRTSVGLAILAVLSICLVPYVLPSAAQADLISRWSGDGTANDYVGGMNGTLAGGATFAPGLVGQAFSLNGIDASVATPWVLPAVGTISCWVNLAPLSPSSSALPIGGTYGTDNGDDRLWIAASGLAGAPGVGPNMFAVNLGSRYTNDIVIPNPLSPGSWQHVALTFDYVSHAYQLYIDAVPVADSAAVRPAPTGFFQIGAVSSDFGQNFFFSGLIDEVAIYNNVLSGSDIQTIFNANNPGGAAVPEPSTLLLLGLGALLLTGYRAMREHRHLG